MRKIGILLILLISAFLQIKAEEIELTINVDTPGTLENKIFDMNQRPLYVTKLTLTGTLDETDFKVMREIMTSLHTVDISKITNIADVNFSNHKNLREIYLPEKLVSIPDNAFSGCSALSYLNIPSTVLNFGYAAFYGCSSLDSIVIPDGVTILEDNLFAQCAALRIVDIPENVTFIGDAVFQGCSSLKSIFIPNTLNQISSNLFSGCSSLKSIVIPRECEVIYANAFAYCSNLEIITIPSKVSSIRNDVFLGCEKLDTIVCLSAIPPQVLNLGINESNCILKVPNVTYNDYIRHSYWGKFYTIETLNIGYKFITVSSNDSIMGIIEGSGYYMIGDTIEIRAIPKGICKFVKWNDDCVDNPRVIEIKDSMNVDYQAIFERDTLIENKVSFNYFDLDREGVTCLVGDATNLEFSLTGYGKYGAGPIDYGESDIRSRHTVNYKKGEYDSRTGNQLRTIPEGSLASVRLGNWSIGGEAEAIVYDFYVSDTTAILLVKYAIVLEAPGHGPMSDPYFRIEILDEAGNVIDTRCGNFEFTPENPKIRWFVYENFVWCDWSSIGLDLSRYHGQMVKIRFITRDCTYSAHAGYAYFTIDCANIGIKKTVLEEEGLVELEAPEGFRYIWTKRSEPDKVLSTERVFMLLYGDTAIYDCQVEYVDMDGCGFILSASGEDLEPYADFVYEWTPRNCENYIYFRSTSSMVNVDGEKRGECETYCWYLNGNLVSKDTEFEYQFDNEGGEFDVRLETGIFNGENVDDTIIVINIPQLGEYRDTIYDTICERDYTHDFTSMPESGIYVDTLVSVAGCDSIIVLDLTVLPTVDVDTMITIKEGEELDFAGEIYTEAGIYHIDRALDTICQNITLCLIVETALEDVNAKDLVVAPNPIGVDGNAVVEYAWSVEEQDGLRVEIINSLGQRVDMFEPKSYPIVLPRFGGAGIYYVRITTGTGGVYVGKLMVEDR